MTMNGFCLAMLDRFSYTQNYLHQARGLPPFSYQVHTLIATILIPFIYLVIYKTKKLTAIYNLIKPLQHLLSSILK